MKTLKAFSSERYLKMKRENQKFMLAWCFPMSLSILIRFILMLEITGAAEFADSTRNFWRTFQTINLGLLYMLQSYGLLLSKGSNDALQCLPALKAIILFSSNTRILKSFKKRLLNNKAYKRLEPER